MMESVEDIPAEAILDALPWDWETYGEYYDSIDRLPKGPNTGGLVGHCALRTYVMGERGLDEAPATGDDVVAMARLVDEAMARVRSACRPAARSCTVSPTDDRCPAPTPPPTNCWPSPRCSAVTAPACSKGAMRLGERDNERFDNSRSEVALLGEISRQSGRPVSFGLTQSDTPAGLMRRGRRLRQGRERGGRRRPAADHGSRRGSPVRARVAHAVRRCAVVEGAARRRQRSQDADVARRVVPSDA